MCNMQWLSQMEEATRTVLHGRSREEGVKAGEEEVFTSEREGGGT